MYRAIGIVVPHLMGECHRCGAFACLFSSFLPIVIAGSIYPEALPLIPVAVIIGVAWVMFACERAIKRRDQREVLVFAVLIPDTIDVDHHEPLYSLILQGGPIGLGRLPVQPDRIGYALAGCDGDRAARHQHVSAPVVDLSKNRGRSEDHQERRDEDAEEEGTGRPKRVPTVRRLRRDRSSSIRARETKHSNYHGSIREL